MATLFNTLRQRQESVHIQPCGLWLQPPGYLTLRCLPAISNQSGHADLWPPTSTSHFPPHSCHSLDFFFFPVWAQSLWTLCDVCDAVRIPVDRLHFVSETLRPACSDSLQSSSSRSLNASKRLIGCLAFHVVKQLNIIPIKVAKKLKM